MNQLPYDNYCGWLANENQRLNNLLEVYYKKNRKLDRKIQYLTAENKLLREFLDKYFVPLKIEQLHLSSDFNLEHLRVNSIQSGAALNIGERILNNTNSDMDMKLGPNSMNNGDHNVMEHGTGGKDQHDIK